MKRLLLLITICISSVSFGQVPSYVPTNGLVGWWGFNGNANDESGNGNDGTVNGATLTTDRLGNPNSAYDFDGVTNFIEIPNLSAVEGVTEMTWSVWVLPRTYGSLNHVIDNSSSGQQYNRMKISIGNYSCQNHSFRMSLDNTQYECAFTDSILSSDSLFHLVVVYRGNEPSNELKLRLYVNGIEQVSTYQNLNACTPITIPSQTQGTGNPWNIGGLSSNSHVDGIIDDIGIWNRALTECEIQDLYNAGVNSIAGVTQTDVTLTADQNNATYQWIDCDNNNSPISGETNQSYTPTVTGNYAVEVTVNGCTSVSECVLVDFTGVDELLNPTMKKLVKIVNLLGQEVEYTPNTVLIYQYSDGTSEKVFTIED